MVILLCLLLLFIAITPNVCKGQNDTKEKTLFYRTDSVQKIEEVVVYGSRIAKEVIPVQTLEGKQLQKLNVHSVADAIRYFSGAQIKDYGGIGGLKTVNIRSMGSHHVGVFYDGVELGNAQNGVVDLGRFSLENMEAISMYNGQKSAIFQPAKDFASASSIYMSTRTPKFAEGKVSNLNIRLCGGSFDTFNPSILWEQRLGTKASSSLSAEFMNTSGKYKFSYTKKDGYDTTEVRKNGDVMAIRVEGAAFGQINKGEWKTKCYLYVSERGYPGASVRETPGKFKHQDRQWDNNIFLQSSLRKYFAPQYSLLVNAKYAYDYLHYRSDPRLDVSTMYVDNNYYQQEVYVSAAHLFSVNGWWNISLSNDFQLNTLEADLVNFVYPTRNMFLTSLATSLQLKHTKIQSSLLYTFVHDITEISGANADNKNEFTPTVVASLKPFDNINLNFRAFYKRVFRMPTLNDLYYTFIGNKDLNPEYTNQYNFGVTYNIAHNHKILKNTELQVDGYFNQVEDKIIAMPTSNQFRWTMLNLGYVEIRGVDLAIQNQLCVSKLNLNLRLNYTYQKAQDFTDSKSESYGGQIPYIPWHSGTAVIDCDFNLWTFSYSFIYTGERYESVANIPENYAQPWYTHDLSITRNLKVNGVGFRVTAEINNLLNQQYEVVQCYPMPGTNFKFKLNVLI